MGLGERNNQIMHKSSHRKMLPRHMSPIINTHYERQKFKNWLHMTSHGGGVRLISNAAKKKTFFAEVISGIVCVWKTSPFVRFSVPQKRS